MKGRELGDGSIRNSSCACGSGKKVKNCCRGAASKPFDTLEKIDKEVEKIFNRKQCSVPKIMQSECNKIVRAHTVSKSSSLKRIARDGKVYVMKPRIPLIRKYGGRVEPSLDGVNKASVFNGFCSKHDSELFASIEKGHLFAGTSEQRFMLHYRALCRELYAKQGELKVANISRQLIAEKKDRHFKENASEYFEFYERGIKLALSDLRNAKHILDQMLISQSFDGIRSYILKLDAPPPIMCSTFHCPEIDFNGNALQDLSNPKIKGRHISANLFCDSNSGYIVFSWTEESDETCKRFVNSLSSTDDEQLSRSIAAYVFDHFENIYFSPVWWDSLPRVSRDMLMDIFYRFSSFLDLSEQLVYSDYRDPAIKPWKIISRSFVRL